MKNEKKSVPRCLWLAAVPLLFFAAVIAGYVFPVPDRSQTAPEVILAGYSAAPDIMLVHTTVSGIETTEEKRPLGAEVRESVMMELSGAIKGAKTMRSAAYQMKYGSLGGMKSVSLQYEYLPGVPVTLSATNFGDGLAVRCTTYAYYHFRDADGYAKFRELTDRLDYPEE